jgi:hypothetical protein
MSLKAYDGLKTEKGFFYIQEKIKKNIDKFREASENKIAKTYADIILDIIDGKDNVDSKLLFQAKTKDDELLILQVSKKDVSILSYLFQVGKILSKSYFANDFCAHLNLSLEAKGEKILIYPGIMVSEHKAILDTFLDDWYAQNQTDKPENVSDYEWEERCKDWWDFNESEGLTIVIKLFDPFHYRDNIVENFRGEELINKILANIPPDEKRIEKIIKRDFIYKKIEEIKSSLKEEKSLTSIYFQAIDFLKTEDGKLELENYKNSQEVVLTKIDEDFLLNYKVN